MHVSCGLSCDNIRHPSDTHPTGEEDFDPKEAEAFAEEEWANELLKPKSDTVMRGSNKHAVKPEAVECIGYSLFFDSMFELADTYVGLGGGIQEDLGVKYAAFLLELIKALLKQNENGKWTWAGAFCH